MTTDRGAVGEALATGLTAIGCGSAGRSAVDALGAGSGAVADARTVLIALELGSATEEAARMARAVTERGDTSIVVAAVPTGADSADGARTDVDHEALSTLRAAADTVLLVSARLDAVASLAGALRAFDRLADETGLVNLDLADVDTVLSAGDLALFASGRPQDAGDGRATAPGTASTADTESTARRARAVVERALSGVPTGFGVDDAPTVLVHVRCGEAVSVGDAGTAVDAVREGVGPNAHVIWGTTIHGTDGAGEGDRRDVEGVPPETLGVDLVVGGVVRTVAGGDPCPRCGATIVEYTLGERSTVACDDCGYAGVRTELGV